MPVPYLLDLSNTRSRFEEEVLPSGSSPADFDAAHFDRQEVKLADWFYASARVVQVKDKPDIRIDPAYLEAFCEVLLFSCEHPDTVIEDEILKRLPARKARWKADKRPNLAIAPSHGVNDIVLLAEWDYLKQVADNTEMPGLSRQLFDDRRDRVLYLFRRQAERASEINFVQPFLL